MVRQYTTDIFKDVAEKAHGNKYDYSKVDYTKSTEKVVIICSQHGEFSQVAAEHVRGRGCDKCGGTAKSNKEEFVQKSKEVHNSKYDYTESVYVNDSVKLRILCNKCSLTFDQSPNNHLQGHGCPYCMVEIISEKQRSNTPEFKEKIVSLYGNKFDLSKTQYGKNCKEKVIVTCHTHGDFRITPTDLISGNGCPACAKYGFRDNIKGSLYVATSGDLTKVGLTNTSAEKRIQQVSRSSGLCFQLIKVYDTLPTGSLRELEGSVLLHLKKRYKNPVNKFNGYTESFCDVNLIELLNTIDTQVSNIDNTKGNKHESSV